MIHDNADQDPRAPTPSALRRLVLSSRPRATKANIVAALLALLLGFAISTQVHQNQSQGLETLRQSDLLNILDSAAQESTRLDQNVRELQTTRDQLVSGSTSGAAAIKAAQQRLDALGILAGTAPAHGPGIQMTVNDPGGKVTFPILLDAIQELRDAGAEAIQINNVRIAASSYFGPSASGIKIDGMGVNQPYTITAIADPATMASAMEIPGGLAENVRQLGATIIITQERHLTVGALHPVAEPRYARPVPPSPPATP